MYQRAATKAAAGQRLNFEEAAALYEQADLLSLAVWARAAKERKSGRQVFFNVNRHMNLTNICTARCPLCAFSCSADNSRAYVLELEDVERIARETAQQSPDITEFHMVSALHPTKPFSYYVEVLKTVKRILPRVHIKAFTPVEIVHFAGQSGLAIADVLQTLRAAGLDSLPGGGAEILDDEIRRVICPDKATSQQWIEVITTAHKLGILTNATMLYGHMETVEQRIRHLLALRDIQDQTNGFQAFVSFPFHPTNTGLSQVERVTAWEDLKMIAMARLILDNVDHIKAFWMMLTLPIAQMALHFGADDLDGTVVEEKIIHAAGAATQTGITKKEIIRLIQDAGFTAVERDTFYHPVQV